MCLETLCEATRRLARSGYVEAFRAEREGLRVLGGDDLFRPEELVVDEVARFEGPSDPADEAAIFALRTPDGRRGTFVINYGPGTAADEAAMAKRLHACAPR